MGTGRRRIVSICYVYEWKEILAGSVDVLRVRRKEEEKSSK